MKKITILFYVFYSSLGFTSEPFDQFSKDLIGAINQDSSDGIEKLSLGENPLFPTKPSEGSIPEDYNISFKKLSSKEIEANTNALEILTESGCKFVKPPTHQVHISWQKEPPFRSGHICYRTESSSIVLFFVDEKQPKLVKSCSDEYKNNYQQNSSDVLSAAKGQFLSEKQIEDYSLLMGAEGYRAVKNKLKEIRPKLSYSTRSYYLDEICKLIP